MCASALVTIAPDFFSQKVPTRIEDLEPIGELGQGTCGHVVRMRHRRTNHEMAVKVRTIDELSIL